MSKGSSKEALAEDELLTQKLAAGLAEDIKAKTGEKNKDGKEVDHRQVQYVAVVYRDGDTLRATQLHTSNSPSNAPLDLAIKEAGGADRVVALVSNHPEALVKKAVEDELRIQELAVSIEQEIKSRKGEKNREGKEIDYTKVEYVAVIYRDGDTLRRTQLHTTNDTSTAPLGAAIKEAGDADRIVAVVHNHPNEHVIKVTKETSTSLGHNFKANQLPSEGDWKNANIKFNDRDDVTYFLLDPDDKLRRYDYEDHKNWDRERDSYYSTMSKGNFNPSLGPIVKAISPGTEEARLQSERLHAETMDMHKLPSKDDWENAKETFKKRDDTTYFLLGPDEKLRSYDYDDWKKWDRERVGEPISDRTKDRYSPDLGPVVEVPPQKKIFPEPPKTDQSSPNTDQASPQSQALYAQGMSRQLPSMQGFPEERRHQMAAYATCVAAERGWNEIAGIGMNNATSTQRAGDLLCIAGKSNNPDPHANGVAVPPDQAMKATPGEWLAQADTMRETRTQEQAQTQQMNQSQDQSQSMEQAMAYRRVL